MSASKADRDRPTAEDLGGVTVTIEGPENLEVRRRTRPRAWDQKIVEISFTCNRRLADTESSVEPVQFELDGRERLYALAAHFGQMLEMCLALKNGEVLFNHVASLTICMAESVFAQHGPQTAGEVALSILGQMGFQLRRAIARDELVAKILDCVKSANVQRLATCLKDSFESQ